MPDILARVRTTAGIFTLVTLALLASPSVAWAGTISAQGNVTALTNVDQLQGIVANAGFDEANLGNVPLAQYTPLGMTFQVGPLSAILPGVLTLGSASQPAYQANGNFFPAPIGGGGVAEESYGFKGGAVTFDLPITQFGLTGSSNGKQYITAWDQNGAMIGQVTWTPNGDAAFVGIDTQGVPIGLLTVGNDNLWTGSTYDIGGLAIYTDTWIWAGIACSADAECQPDANLCTDDVCLDGVCQQPFNTVDCDDLDACTQLDQCSMGECVGAAVDCNDDDLCTVEQCDVALGCVIEAMPGCCTTDEQCMAGEICQLGSNSCIPEPGGDSTTDTGAETATGGSSSSSGDSSSSGTGDSSDSSSDDAVDGVDEVGDDDPPLAGPGEAGCSCASDPEGGATLFGFLGLGLLGWVGRRR